MRLPSLPWLSALHLQAHRTGGAGDHRHRGVDVVGVEILHLLLGDLADLRLVIVPADSLPGSLEPDFRSCRLLEQVGHRRQPGLEGEALVRVDGDHDRSRSALLLSLRVLALNALQNSMMLRPR
jgi:hypothetical protein